MIKHPAYGLISAVLLLVFFIPAFTTFFTHDDFFHLYLSRPGHVLSVFRQFPHFRPLTTQIYYQLSTTPQVLRLISLAALLFIGFQVNLLTARLTHSARSGGIAAMLYLTSATHYAHLNYSGAFHELGLAIFILAGCLSLWHRPGLSPLFFVLALSSKETAVVYPGLLLLLSWHLPGLKTYLGTHLVILGVYLLFRFVFFGFATGDSYVWILSPQILNTLGWYGLWSFNLPEMWVDFIGPGLQASPNLLRYWGQSTLIISSLFLILVSAAGAALAKNRINRRTVIFCFSWFVISLGPLLFLPWHKFTFYLTLPLVGISLFLGQILSTGPKFITKVFVIIWIFLSIATYALTLRTNWITQGAQTAARFHAFFQSGKVALAEKTLVFYDTPDDASLPWSPSQVLKDVLSDNNYFRVYSFSTQAIYSSSHPDKIESNAVPLNSRQFLGY